MKRNDKLVWLYLYSAKVSMSLVSIQEINKDIPFSFLESCLGIGNHQTIKPTFDKGQADCAFS